MPYCVAHGCNRESRKCSGISCFSFLSETDKPSRHIWIQACRRGEAKWVPSKHARLCSLLFEKGQLDRYPELWLKLLLYSCPQLCNKYNTNLCPYVWLCLLSKSAYTYPVLSTFKEKEGRVVQVYARHLKGEKVEYQVTLPISGGPEHVPPLHPIEFVFIFWEWEI
jgi:hypothetical protein